MTCGLFSNFLTITDSTISGNTAAGTADEFYSLGTDTISNSTIGGNIGVSGTLVASNLTSVASNLTSVTGGTFSVEVYNGGNLQLPSSIDIPSLTIDAGGFAQQTSTDTTFGSEVLTVGSLSIAGPSGSTNGGKLDLGYGDMIVQQTDANSVIQPLLAAGYDNGLWDGVGPTGGPNPAAIISSAAANDPYGIEALGYAQVGTDAGDLNYSTYDGQDISTGDTIVALTYYGDANLDRQINSTDYGMFGATYPYISTQIGGWTGGDFSYDGSVDLVDRYLMHRSSGMLQFLAAVNPPRIIIDHNLDLRVNPIGSFNVTVTNGGNAMAGGGVTVASIKNAAGANFAVGNVTVTGIAATGPNSWKVTVNAAGLGPGEYIVTLNVGNAGTKTILITR